MLIDLAQLRPPDAGESLTGRPAHDDIDRRGGWPEIELTGQFFRMRHRDIPRLAVSGAAAWKFGQLCIIAFYDFWEDYLRLGYVKAKGLYDRNDPDKSLRDHGSNDLWAICITCVRPSCIITA